MAFIFHILMLHIMGNEQDELHVLMQASKYDIIAKMIDIVQ